jgi:hypothetical protein
MELYAGNIPKWLSECDRKNLTSKIKIDIINEANSTKILGISGRDSINLFNEFYSQFNKNSELINICNLHSFCTDYLKKLYNITDDFLNSVVSLYNFETLQEIKESLYSFNEEQISLDIKHYLFAINYNVGTMQFCNYTNQNVKITNEFFETIEQRILGDEFKYKKMNFRNDIQKEFSCKTLTQ